MFEFFNWIWNISSEYFFNNCMEFNDTSDNMKEYIEEENSNTNYICSICSYNMRNTRCYEFECVNYGRDILPEF